MGFGPVGPARSPLLYTGTLLGWLPPGPSPYLYSTGDGLYLVGAAHYDTVLVGARPYGL